MIIIPHKSSASPLCIVILLFCTAIGLGTLFISLYQSQESSDRQKIPEFLQLGLGFFGSGIFIVLCTAGICYYMKYECTHCSRNSSYNNV